MCVSVEDYTDGYMQSLAMVHNDGTVFWPPIVRFQSTCKIDITFFPFDDQLCRMKLGSWAYDGFQVKLKHLYSSSTPFTGSVLMLHQLVPCVRNQVVFSHKLIRFPLWTETLSLDKNNIG